jgi:hypothetical protein
MRASRRSRPSTPERELLDYLLQHQRALAASDYALFWVSEEGNWLPSTWHDQQIEEMSGYLVDRQGQVSFFWMGWDTASQAPSLTQWIPVAPKADWADDPEYRSARQQVGLESAST